MSKVLFKTETKYQKSKKYKIMPFKFGKIPNVNKILITNDIGDFYFLTNLEFDNLINFKLNINDKIFLDLLNRNMVYLDAQNINYTPLAAQYRTKKSFLRDGPSLHIFVVSLRCDHSCFYCQVSRQSPDKDKFDMKYDTIDKAIINVFKSPSKNLTIEFQGGEPLLAFDNIIYAVEKILKKNKIEKRNLNFVITSTLHFLDEDKLKFIKDHNIYLSTSLDGPEWLHNSNRPNRNRDSYQKTIYNLKKAREFIGNDKVSALTTLTKKSLEYPREIIDSYVENEFQSIFLRPLSPYGFAIKSDRKIGYGMNDFINFYKIALDYIIEINKKGYSLEEAYTSIILTHILTPFPTGYVDLRSPTGSGIGVLAYNYDGKIYASDEGRMLAEMKDFRFKLGTVNDSYEQIYNSTEMQWLLSASVAESLPGCSDCVFLPYCGSDPVYALAKQGDPIGHRPTSDFCKKQTGIFYEVFEKIYEGNDDTIKVFLSWLNKKNYNEIILPGYLGF